MSIQKRLDAELVGVYEAVLALYTVRLLFPAYVGGANLLPTPEVLWPIKVHEHLMCIIEEREWSHDDGEQEWMAIWESLHTTDKFISSEGVKILLNSASELRGDACGLHPLQNAVGAAESAAQHSTRCHPGDAG